LLAAVLETADQLDGDKVLERHHAYAVDNRHLRDDHAEILGGHGVNGDMIEHMLAPGGIPAGTGGLKLLHGRLAIGGVKVEINGCPGHAMQVHRNAADDGGVDRFLQAAGKVENAAVVSRHAQASFLQAATTTNGDGR
jgi:hypothetical protein